MFDIDSNHSTLLLELKSVADLINENHSSSSMILTTADSRISSRDGKVGRLCGQEESCTFYDEVLLGGLLVTTLEVQPLVQFYHKMGRWLTMTMHCNQGIAVVIV